jgi:hypothetical protein
LPFLAKQFGAIDRGICRKSIPVEENRMSASHPAPRRLDIYTAEMIFVIALITLYDFLLSDALSLPVVLRRSSAAQWRALDQVASGVEFLVPIVFFAAMLILWLIQRNAWVRRLAMVYLAWVTIRLASKVALVVYILVSRPQSGVGVLLKDVLVIWAVNALLFGVWYWILDGGGPDARRDGTPRRFDFNFPQRAENLRGWEKWQPGIWDYLYLGFSGSTQFGLGESPALSWRAKSLVVLQVALSLLVIVFIASIAIGLIH